MAHLTLQQLWMLAHGAIIDDTAESKHLKRCPECMVVVQWFSDERTRELQKQDEEEAMSVLYD